MEEFNTYEYSAEQKPVGKWRTFRILMLSAYIAFAAIYFLVIYLIKLIPLGALIPIALWIIIHFTWRYVKPDYTYTIEAGVFTFYIKYGPGKRRKRASFKISTAECIAPKGNAKSASGHSPKKVYCALPSNFENDAYTAIYTDESGSLCAIHFVATKEALRLLRRHNSKTELSETRK